MNAADPRHGTPAGAQQHWRDGEPACDPCARSRAKASKAARLDADRGRPRTVTLGARAHRVIVSTPRDQLARATGITVHKLGRLDHAGPTKRVHRATRDRILAAASREHFWTPVGIQRRVRALHKNGWSLRALSAEVGASARALRIIALKTDLHFIRRDVALRILDGYERLSMTLPSGCGAVRARRRATECGWEPPLAWDDIDDPEETPAGSYRPPGVVLNRETHKFEWPDEPVDDVAVQRILDGDWRLPCTKADKVAVVARWTGTYGELERLTGWRVERYVVREDVVA